MTKGLLTLSIDIGLLNALSNEKNKSALISNLIERHFNLLPSNQTYEEMLIREKELKAQLEAIERAKANNVQNAEKQTREASKREQEENNAWDEKKKQNIRKQELRKLYEKKTKKENQSYEGFEAFIKENS